MLRCCVWANTCDNNPSSTPDRSISKADWFRSLSSSSQQSRSEWKRLGSHHIYSYLEIIVGPTYCISNLYRVNGKSQVDYLRPHVLEPSHRSNLFNWFHPLPMKQPFLWNADHTVVRPCRLHASLPLCSLMVYIHVLPGDSMRYNN